MRHFLPLSLIFALLLPLAGVSCKPAPQDPPPRQEEAPAPTEEATGASAGEEDLFRHPLELDYQGTLDMGTLYAREQRHASFTLRNTSAFPQEIQDIFPTCPCITMDRSYRGILLAPQEALEIGFTMDAATVKIDSFGRVIQIDSKGNKPLQARVGGHILEPLLATPDKDVDLGALKTPSAPVSVRLALKKNPAMDQPLVLGVPKEGRFFQTELKKTGEDSYELTITSRQDLPYGRAQQFLFLLPIVEPASAREAVVSLSLDVAEKVYFTPDTWRILPESLQEAGSLTERFAYGEVPGLQEEHKAGDPAASNRSLMRRKKTQGNAIPLRFVKEHHDWDDLFAHLEFQVPPGVTLEKVRHPKGVEVKVTVTPACFPPDVTQLRLLPFRGQNEFSPITISLEGGSQP